MRLDKKYVVELLKDYKRLILHRKTLQREFDGHLKASEITDMPHGTDISDPIQQALNKKEHEIKEIEKEIKTVNDWLEYLNDVERFVIEQYYFEELYF